MAEYIKKEDALRQVLLVETRENMFRCIKNIPSADVVERKTGKWAQISPAGIYECSQCGQNVMTSDIEAYKFCHGCGAQMIGGDEDV